MVIPQEATFEIQDKVFAYKVADGKATSTQLDVYSINDGKEYIVQQGLSEGDTIIVKAIGLDKKGKQNFSRKEALKELNKDDAKEAKETKRKKSKKEIKEEKEEA